MGRCTRRHQRPVDLPRDRRAAAACRTLRSPSSLDLAPYELKAFSQNGEDGVLDEILRRIGTETRTFVEIGAGSGDEGICVYLADVAGWAGTFMELSDVTFLALSAKYALNRRVMTVQTKITPRNIEATLAQLGVPTALDVLSIDIDGHDYWVWEAVTAYRPRTVVIEYNAHLGVKPLTMPLDVDPAWDGSDYFGASIAALRQLGDGKGYHLVHCDITGVNAFFVRDDLIRDHFPKPSDVVVRAPNFQLQGRRHPAGAGRWQDVGAPAAPGRA